LRAQPKGGNCSDYFQLNLRSWIRELILQQYLNKMNPTENDVLSGRGAWFNQHPGNQQFRNMIDDQKVRQSQHYPFCPISIDDFYGLI